MEKIKEQLLLIWKVFLDFLKDLPLIHGAALAYYTILALVPILYLSFQFYGAIVGDEFIKVTLESFLKKEIGIDNIGVFVDMLNGVDLAEQSFALKVSGFIAIAFSCTAILSSLRTSINTFYKITPPKKKPHKLILSELIFRLVALLSVASGVLLIMMIYFAETVLLGVSSDLFADRAVIHWFFIEFAKHGLPIVSNVLLLIFVFKYLHDGRVSWKVARRGAIVTGVLLYLGQVGLKLYVTNYFFASGIGVAGSILMILVWVYYSSLIVLLGAKFTAAYARSRGEKLTID
ncbi:MAG: YihY/virulence factor BrkB family protein [Bacteroidetes bacterium]|nr:MAG: YihY/virulence factor BrkB family protein [Bacteroidota bacterium]TNE97596.1 MAG: YihY/virulence factor BrkB family protein [Bacteroidota bacterium]